MRRLLLSTLTAAGLTLVGVNSFAVDVNSQDAQMEQNIKQDTKQEAETQKEITGTSETESKTPAKGEEHFVKEGETLSVIAKEFLGSEGEWRAIADLNDIKDPDRIFVGQHLRLPSTKGELDAETKEQMKQETKQEVAGETDNLKEVTGEVTAIKDSTLTVKDEMGKIHTIKAVQSLKADSLEFEEVEVGDDIEVHMENGKAISIEKVESGPTGGSTEGASSK
ncbi:MAG: LysM peptidoglycan-binding domain-containing protein [Thermodesulfobacteriota bacterium]